MDRYAEVASWDLSARKANEFYIYGVLRRVRRTVPADVYGCGQRKPALWRFRAGEGCPPDLRVSF